jgi:hypothetical protein
MADNPLHRTEKLAMGLVAAAVTIGNETQIEMTKGAIAIFTKCTAAWAVSIVEAVKIATEGTSSLVPPNTDYKGAIRTAMRADFETETVKRTLQELAALMGEDFKNEHYGNANNSCAASEKAVSKTALDARDMMDESMRTLVMATVDGCMEIAGQLLDSKELEDDLVEWGILDTFGGIKSKEMVAALSTLATLAIEATTTKEDSFGAPNAAPNIAPNDPKAAPKEGPKAAPTNGSKAAPKAAIQKP